MADQNKFEKMLELLVNEDKEAAQELFHEIVVEKSRDIYESILEDEADVEEATDEEVDETTDEEVEESKGTQTAGEEMREYVEKVSATMGDNGANTKSAVANPNNMGGTASNLAQGADEKGGSAAGPKEDDAGNRNKPGGMSAKKGMKNEPGHGAEKKGKPEAATDKKSSIGS